MERLGMRSPDDGGEKTNGDFLDSPMDRGYSDFLHYIYFHGTGILTYTHMECLGWVPNGDL